MSTTKSKSDVINLQIQLSDATPSEAIPVPYVREANETSELDVSIANRGFTLVLPAFKEEIFDELIMTFSTLDYSANINSNLITFKSGEASIDTVTKDQITGTFKRGDKARIRVFLRVYGDIWMAGKDSIEYNIV
ncbi:hypothetical protein PSCICN_43380 [Pseudomonas cichorii]|uniref:hypothetical protein n=1 Tax=Pseudomonas cichorii TaxID=36746 RepID=UPI00190FFC4B|nr:hypothetical protein [Pseudomonas cichorii]GFM83646.1 hypothetical protein PSCICN_43380 [Pseudomonas cichorii]